jgi:hypothetical protein
MQGSQRGGRLKKRSERHTYSYERTALTHYTYYIK